MRKSVPVLVRGALTVASKKTVPPGAEEVNGLTRVKSRVSAAAGRAKAKAATATVRMVRRKVWRVRVI
jgi:hypothetical protein